MAPPNTPSFVFVPTPGFRISSSFRSRCLPGAPPFVVFHEPSDLGFDHLITAAYQSTNTSSLSSPASRVADISSLIYFQILVVRHADTYRGRHQNRVRLARARGLSDFAVNRMERSGAVIARALAAAHHLVCWNVVVAA